MMKCDTCVTAMTGRHAVEHGLSVVVHSSLFRYRVCLALQVANLLTRAMFAHRLAMNDLPAVGIRLARKMP